MVVGLLLVTIALVIRHWRGASPESRLALDPVLGVSGLATVSLLATVVAQGLGLDGAVAALGAAGTLFVLIPIAFLAGLLRLRLHRAREADLEVERLQAQLRAQLVEVRASRARIVEAGDAERRRLERDLHDGAQQRLLGVRLALRTARMRLADGSTDSVDELLAEADAEVMDALAELRDLAHGIQPAVLTEEGIGPALAALARRTPVPVELEVSAGRLPPAVEATAYFVAAESLANIVKHADASWARVSVVTGEGRVLVAVDDDGRGGADPDGAGLRGLRDRVEAVDGRFSRRVTRRRRDPRQRVDLMRVIIADDAVIVRQGVARLLAERGIEVVGEAGRTEELLRLVAALRPDVAVIDIRMPPTQTDEGLVAAREIRRRFPAVGTLVLSQHAESGYAFELIAGGDGSVGYLLKDRVVDVDQLVDALDRIRAGGVVVEPALVDGLLARSGRLGVLTPREREVLALVAQGKTDRGIALELVVTRKTVEAHVRSILAKLELPEDVTENRRVHAVLAFLQAGADWSRSADGECRRSRPWRSGDEPRGE